jgi:1-acyl-sn-glycerol-3-phosphate acyltransferase
MPDDPHFDRTLVVELSQTAFGRALADLPIKYFDATLEGVERIPESGGALLVGNHAMFGLDGVVLGSLVLRATKRVPRFLAERNLWRIPGLGRVLTSVGALPGEPVAATELLERGEIVIVYPGGVDDSFKTSAERYRLQWGHRAGFAKIAMRARVPIIPALALGIDGMYAIPRREKTLGRWLLGSARYDFPLARGILGTWIPHPVKQSYHLLEPIDTSGDPENAEDVERVRAATYDALDSRLKEARAP